jgi:2-amino-4-hydroxy-6-hydroxymethyldihydropteridine diphosphokinase
MPRVFVAAGSNIEPEHNLVLASRELCRAWPQVQFSPWYRNRAADFAGEDFINFAVGFDSAEPVQAVVAKLRAIEELCGRPRAAAKWAPRSMDLDVLL